MNLPNKLTVARIIAVPFFIFCYMKGFFVGALLLFIVASLTDMLDGRIARKYNLITNFGKIMDPLADKVLVYSAFCLMVADGSVPAWMFAIILAREFLVAGVRTVAASEGIVIAADMSGKIKTVLQMIAVPLLILYKILTSKRYGFYPGVVEWPETGVVDILGKVFLWGALIMTIVSGAEYVLKNKSLFKE